MIMKKKTGSLGTRPVLFFYIGSPLLHRISGWLSVAVTHMRQLSCEIRNRNLKMPKPYLVDLRLRIIWLFMTHSCTPLEIAQLLCVSERSVWRYVKLVENTGDVEPVSQRHMGH